MKMPRKNTEGRNQSEKRRRQWKGEEREIKEKARTGESRGSPNVHAVSCVF